MKTAMKCCNNNLVMVLEDESRRDPEFHSFAIFRRNDDGEWTFLQTVELDPDDGLVDSFVVTETFAATFQHNTSTLRLFQRESEFEPFAGQTASSPKDNAAEFSSSFKSIGIQSSSSSMIWLGLSLTAFVLFA